MTAVPIGETARQSGVKAPTIRYYEQIGLLPAPPRSEGNRRQYDAEDLRRLVFIRHARELGFDIDAIRALLVLQDEPGQSCAVADQIARARLVEVEQRIASLRALKAELQRMVTSCSHGRVDQCRVIEALADSPANRPALSQKTAATGSGGVILLIPGEAAPRFRDNAAPRTE